MRVVREERKAASLLLFQISSQRRGLRPRGLLRARVPRTGGVKVGQGAPPLHSTSASLDAVDRERGLGNVGSDDHLAGPWRRRLEDPGLQVGGQVGVDRGDDQLADLGPQPTGLRGGKARARVQGKAWSGWVRCTEQEKRRRGPCCRRSAPMQMSYRMRQTHTAQGAGTAEAALRQPAAGKAAAAGPDLHRTPWSSA